MSLDHTIRDANSFLSSSQICSLMHCSGKLARMNKWPAKLRAKRTTTVKAPKPTPKPTPRPTPAKTSPSKPSSSPSAAKALALHKLPAKAKAEYDRLMLEVEAAKLDEHRGWDRLWEIAKVIIAKRLYLLEADTPTADDWTKKHTGEIYRTAARYMLVATMSSPAEQQKYTVSKIALAYELATAQAQALAAKRKEHWSAPETPEKLNLAKLKYTVVREKKKRTVDLAEITAVELRTAIRGLRRVGAPAPQMGPTATKLVAALAKDSALDNITVQERGQELSFAHVRADQLPQLAALLAKLGK